MYQVHVYVCRSGLWSGSSCFSLARKQKKRILCFIPGRDPVAVWYCVSGDEVWVDAGFWQASQFDFKPFQQAVSDAAVCARLIYQRLHEQEA